MLLPFSGAFFLGTRCVEIRLVCSSIKISSNTFRSRLFATSSALSSQRKSLILGVYETKDSNDLLLTPSAEKYNAQVNGKLLELIKSSGPKLKQGKSREFFGLGQQDYSCVSVTCLGEPNLGYNELEEIEEKRENIRCAVGVAAKKLRDLEPGVIVVDDCGDVEAAAEGASLSLHCYDELKKEKKHQPTLQLFNTQASSTSWQNGLIKAEAQKTAAKLMETPANHLTPTKFAEVADNLLSKKGISVIKRDKSWAESKGMGSFLSVSRGSDEPPVFLELKYKGREEDAKPLVLVGKGITFDSGGISLKPSANMDEMRADMGGAACIVGTFLALSELKPPINVVGLIPLCENMPSGKATKPGDVVTAMNGKTIQVDNTDAEGRLILADALCYAHEFNPMAILDLATLTGAMIVAVGSAATGVFTNSSKMWMILQQAGMGTGDRMWRFPLWKHYTKAMTECRLADINNISGAGSKGGGACTAAAFLKEFVTHDHWLHLDIAGVMSHNSEIPYLAKGMAGRPTRTLVEFVQRLSQYGH